MSKSEAPLFIAEPLLYFDRNGKCDFPTLGLVRSNALKNITTALILDANVCLNLSNFSRGKMDVAKDSKFRQFLLAAELSKVDIVPYFGCLELSSSRVNGQVNMELLSSFASNVSRALAQREESLALGRRPTWIEDKPEVTDTSLSAILPGLRYIYCCFLKIFEIRSRGFLKPRAVKNFIEFFDWCEAMECHVGLVSQAALTLFGGAKGADKLLNPSKRQNPLDAAWGAAWDMWYCWMVQNYLPTLPVDGVNQHSIFATDDESAAFIAEQCFPTAMFLNSGKPVLSASSLNFDFPYYKDNQDRLNRILYERKEKRLSRIISKLFSDSEFEHDRVEAEIKRLEKSIMAAWSKAGTLR